MLVGVFSGVSMFDVKIFGNFEVEGNDVLWVFFLIE